MSSDNEKEEHAHVAPTGADGTPLNLYERRLLIASHETGFTALFTNRHVFSIAVFASLGGLIYGFNQGMFGQILNMASFSRTVNPNSISNPTSRGLLTSILELGAWVGSLANGYLADKLGRKLSVVLAVVIFIIGVIVQATAHNANQILGGRFVTGLGVGSLSMIVPLYNAELAPAEVRGALVALQQLAITFGIMIAYFIGYGTNFIGGAGNPNQSNAAWLIPVCIQLIPALILGTGFLTILPQSPRYLVQINKEDEALEVLSKLRRVPKTNEIVVLEFLEIKAQHMFEIETDREMFPHLMDGSFSSSFKLRLAKYKSLFVDKSLRPRTFIGIFIMVFQQWTGMYKQPLPMLLLSVWF
ncbi:Snf3p [Sugiyamaella lignohabitans]|uniref:Snf3p n=1 Tax=Sugiyamaella lignohabitans TaxID=796027 RepID=A0A167F8X4_9ASCO|nr:Snf3p [Sugiyamaella lignohabitans]ANB14974.1 Snf3p [Sugiyamaella lignohabitans]